jgi:hypothetical protein
VNVLIQTGALVMFEIKDRSAYFVSRHEAETAAAEAATTHLARIAHLELALRYSLLAAQSGGANDNAGVTEEAMVNLTLHPST